MSLSSTARRMVGTVAGVSTPRSGLVLVAEVHQRPGVARRRLAIGHRGDDDHVVAGFHHLVGATVGVGCRSGCASRPARSGRARQYRPPCSGRRARWRRRHQEVDRRVADAEDDDGDRRPRQRPTARPASSAALNGRPLRAARPPAARGCDAQRRCTRGRYSRRPAARCSPPARSTASPTRSISGSSSAGVAAMGDSMRKERHGSFPVMYWGMASVAWPRERPVGGTKKTAARG